jgi:hypothetical protein
MAAAFPVTLSATLEPLSWLAISLTMLKRGYIPLSVLVKIILPFFTIARVRPFSSSVCLAML